VKSEAKSDEPFDALGSRRLHCWVLVRGGKRGMHGFSFVEPTPRDK